MRATLNSSFTTGALAALILGLAAASANAIMVDLTVDPNLPPGTTPYVLGAANPGAPASDANVATYINGILGLPLGGTGTAGSDAVYRSLNVFSGLPTAGTVTTTGDDDFNAPVDTITLTSSYEFLSGKYDGQNGGDEIWYIGNLAVGTTIVIPDFAFGTSNYQYGLSTTILMTPESPNSVPDGGSTVMLLGSAMAGLGSLRAFSRRK